MIKKIKQILNNRDTLLGLLLALICTFIHIPRYFDAYYLPLDPPVDIWWGLDLSWMLTLNYISIKDLNWGVDFAFTYGPLSYLSTRVGWGHKAIEFILFDIFFYVNLFLIYFFSYKKSNNKLFTALLIISYTILIPIYIGPPISLLLLFFLIFWIRLSIDKPKFIFYLFQFILLGLLFFIKFNTGLIAFPLFILGLLYNLLTKKEKFYWLLLYLFIPIIFVFITCSYLNVNFVNYTKTAFEIISGYNDIMYLEHKTLSRLLAILVGLSTIFILVHKIIVEKQTNLFKNTTILLLYSIPIFVLYKSGFVRGLETDFFIYSIPLILVIKDLHFDNYKKYSNIILVFCLTSSFAVIYLFKETKMPFETKNKIDKYYLSGLKDFTPISGLHLYPNNNQFPNIIKEKIGSSTVDIYPWNAQLLIENKLNFTPRPVFQAYTAYTKILEELNFNYYNSKEKSPEFVVYEFLGMDERYPLFDEPKVNLCLIKNYVPIEFFELHNRKFLLLQKKNDFKPIRLDKSNEYAMTLESPLVPKKDIFYEIGIYNSITGKVISILNHAPEMILEIKTNTASEYRTGKKLLESGVFLDKKINTTEDFYYLFFTDSIAKLEKIKYYNFKPKSPSLFKDKIRITEYKISQ